jgi:hypothetical protein
MNTKIKKEHEIGVLKEFRGHIISNSHEALQRKLGQFPRSFKLFGQSPIIIT